MDTRVLRRLGTLSLIMLAWPSQRTQAACCGGCFRFSWPASTLLICRAAKVPSFLKFGHLPFITMPTADG